MDNKPKYLLLIKIHKGVQFNFLVQSPGASAICIVNGKTLRGAILRNSPIFKDPYFFDVLLKRFNLLE